MGTFEKHFKQSLKKLFLYNKFRTEKHFLNSYMSHFMLSADNMTFTRKDDNNFTLSVDFGDMIINANIKTKKSAEQGDWLVIIDVT